MSSRLIIRQKRKSRAFWLQKLFGSNRGTHWSIAGSVAVIVLGTYLIYSGHNGNLTTATAISAKAPVSATAGDAELKR
jgi:hypothetical protein